MYAIHDPGSYEDPGPYEDTGLYEDPRPYEDLRLYEDPPRTLWEPKKDPGTYKLN